jgi:hypothetical protein
MPEMPKRPWIQLPPPASWTRRDRQAFISLARAYTATSKRGQAAVEPALSRCLRDDKPALAAAACLLKDLVGQGWALKVDAADNVWTRPPAVATDPGTEKARVRRQELLKRDEQLATPSVQRFIADMERPREFSGRFVSIYTLMRDGQELSLALQETNKSGEEPAAFRNAIDPYLQVVNKTDRCRYTGLKLGDIWRYFRLTWSNQYTSTPGRTMMLLVRDRAAPCHPVIGIAALGSSIVQIKERDDWIGWQSSELLSALTEEPTLRMARWVVRRLDQAIAEIYLEDLLEDGLYWPSLLTSPTSDAIGRLRKEAEARRRDHHRFVRRSELKRSVTTDSEEWRRRAESDLFRSKRCLALADLLRSRLALNRYLYPMPSRDGLRQALDDAEGRRAISDIIRRSKAEAVGTEIADLTVCGAIAPYNALLGGKLVSMLAVSPWVVRAYREHYSDYASVIASSMAGRPVRRRTNLAFIGTTSLYGSGSSQYNRVRIPAEVLGGSRAIEFRELGRSLSYGTSHLSSQTVSALVRLSEQSRNGVRVNSIFGEGVNPKLRKVRDGLDQLGWPAESLMRHGRQRIVYGVSLVSNLLPYLIGADAEPDYVFRRNVKDDVRRISEWWLERWLAPRSKSREVLESVSQHHVDRPVSHGARVPKVEVSGSD